MCCCTVIVAQSLYHHYVMLHNHDIDSRLGGGQGYFYLDYPYLLDPDLIIYYILNNYITIILYNYTTIIIDIYIYIISWAARATSTSTTPTSSTPTSPPTCGPSPRPPEPPPPHHGSGRPRLRHVDHHLSPRRASLSRASNYLSRKQLLEPLTTGEVGG